MNLSKYLNFNSKMIKTTFALTSGRFLNMFVSFILLFIQSRYIGPETTGKIGAFLIPIGYIWIFTLGIPSALARDLPYYIAKGDKKKAMDLAQTAHSFSLLMGLSCSLFFLFLTIKSVIIGDFFNAIGWSFQIINAFFAIYNSYITTLFRTTDEFIYIAKSNTISAITNLMIFPIIFINSLYGLLIKTVASTITTNIYLYKKRPFKFKFSFNCEYFKKLFFFGMPLILIGYIESNLWLSIQSTIILTMGSNTLLGLYNFVYQIILLLLVIPTAVSDILRPKFSSTYGQSNKDLKLTLKQAYKPLLLTFLYSIFSVFVSWLLIDDLIIWLLPKYIDAIPSIKIALFIVPIISIKSIKYIFVVSKDMLNNLISTVPGFIIGILLLYYLMKNDFPFEFIFFPYILGQLINFSISAFILFAKIKKETTNNI